MATIFSHALVVVVAGSTVRLDARVIVWGAMLAILPDIDVIGLPFGIAHYEWFGHRGFTHSLAFALAASGAGAQDVSAFSARKAESLLKTQLPCLGCHTLNGEGVFLAFTGSSPTPRNNKQSHLYSASLRRGQRLFRRNPSTHAHCRV